MKFRSMSKEDLFKERVYKMETLIKMNKAQIRLLKDNTRTIEHSLKAVKKRHNKGFF